MGTTKGYYSLIQYCPDLARLEAVNIGVLLYCPSNSFLKAITNESLSRVQCCFGISDSERERISAMRESIERRLRIEQRTFRGLEDLEHFASSRGNAIQISSPRPVKVSDPEQDLRQLYDQLVEVPPRASNGIGHEISTRRGRKPKELGRNKETKKLLDLGVERLNRSDLQAAKEAIRSAPPASALMETRIGSGAHLSRLHTSGSPPVFYFRLERGPAPASPS